MPQLYNGKNFCRTCSKELETRSHLFTCVGLEQLNFQAWTITMEKLKKRITKLINTNKRINESHNSSSERVNHQKNLDLADTLIDYLTKTIYSKQENRLEFTLGLLQENHVSKFKSILGKGRTSSTKARSLLCKTSFTFQKSFRKLTWNTRCSITVKTDKILGINLKARKSLKQVQKKNIQQTKKKTTEKKTADLDKKNKKDTELVENDSKIKEILYNFIESGTKWLDLR
jgi:dsDNA-binding SOS-regulon protein